MNFSRKLTPMTTDNCQLSQVNCHRSTVTGQLSTVNWLEARFIMNFSRKLTPMTTDNCHRSTVNCQLARSEIYHEF
ncbi:hypothetical protein QUB63_23190 [Microcoleus sp. ARI1-B5]|uniref:hypothetical protein n=1 Tax=unclassified Microcoleus TaxID=2642155 RepID=UPI002FD6D007